MAGIVTRNFRLYNAEQFKESFSEASATNMYLFISNIEAWTDETSPPTPTDTVSMTEYEAWRSMLAAKRISAGSVSYTIPRYNWTTSKVYREYNNYSTTLFDAPTSSNTFYVMTDSYNVYKCLFNNNGAASTVKPTGTSTSVLTTSDGYRWKFMYTVTSGEITSYVTDDYIPVKTLTSNDGSAQWAVQQAAANGVINVIDVTAAGNSYVTHTGTISAVSNTTVIVLQSGASGVDNIYNGSSLFISSGLGSGGVREITDYTGATRSVKIKTPFTVTPNTSSTYILSPTIKISGDGTGATAYCNVVVLTGAINFINTIDVGSNYSKARVTISANTSHGAGANAIAYIPPRGGHGSNAVEELAAHNVIMSISLSGTESNTFPIINDFRTIGLLKDPRLLSNNSIATGSSYNQTTRLTLSSVSSSGDFTSDELIIGNTSFCTARVLGFANTNSANTSGILTVTSANVAFTTSESILANTSGVSGIISTITKGSLKPYTGKVLFVQNRTPITRSTDQTETIKIVAKF